MEDYFTTILVSCFCQQLPYQASFLFFVRPVGFQVEAAPEPEPQNNNDREQSQT